MNARDRRHPVVATSALVRRPIYITAFVTSLAIVGLAGCAGHGEYTTTQKADRAKGKIDTAATVGKYNSEWYRTNAKDVNLPDRWLTEAQTARAEDEARRAAAQSFDLQAKSDVIEGIAATDAALQAAMSKAEIGRAEADKTFQVYAAKLDEYSARAIQSERAYETNARLKDALLNATVKEWESEIDTMRSQSLTDWTQAQAVNTQMHAERDAVKGRGQAEVEQMIRVCDLTDQRAAAKSKALRTEAQSIQQQTAARVDELTQKIKTVTDQSHAQVSELRQKATSLDNESSASVTELRAKSVSVQEQDAEQTYMLRLKAAEAAFNQAKADSERLFQNSSSMEQTGVAEVSRMLSDAQKQLEMDRTAYEEARVAIDSFVEHGKADVAMKRVEAVKVEKQSRAEFVKAEAEARASAIRETAKHQNVMAEKEFERLTAQAEDEAAKIAASYAEAIKSQTAQGLTTMPRNPKQREGTITSAAPSPKMPIAGDAPAVLEPQRVAAFKTALAQASMLRTQADADERNLFATAEERTQKFQAWWQQQQASNEATIAQAQSLNQKANAEVARLNSEAESKLKVATAELDRARIEAEAQKRETVASIANMQAEANATEKKAGASVTQLRAQAEVAERNAQSEIRALEVVRDSTRRRGDARHDALLAEAASVEETQRAVVAQMRQEIQTAQQVMTSELARLEQAANSYLAIAEATYQEGVATAEKLAKITAANSDEARSSNETERKIAAADVEHMRGVQQAQELVAAAEVSKMLANAEAGLENHKGYDMYRRAEIASANKMANAEVQAQLATANANDSTTRAMFTSRIALTEADRNRAFAQQYVEGMQSKARLEQARAAAKAYRDISNEAVVRMREQGKTFEDAARQNWYSRLALPASYPTPENTTDLDFQAQQNLAANPPAFPAPRAPAFDTASGPNLTLMPVQDSASHADAQESDSSEPLN